MYFQAKTWKTGTKTESMTLCTGPTVWALDEWNMRVFAPTGRVSMDRTCLEFY